MNKTIAILKRQFLDTLRNKAVLIQFLMFPMMTILMTQAIQVPNMPPRFFAILFATMYIGMAPLVVMSSIISEEKEKNTLRVLLFANVKPREYIIGTGIYVFVMCMMGSIVFVICGDFKANEILIFEGIMAAGFVISIFVGACIGIFSKNQMAATAVTVPVMMIFSFVPMLSMFNEKIQIVSKLLYTEEIRKLMNSLTEGSLSVEGSFPAIVLICNGVIVLLVFRMGYKKGFEA